jgi:hypothetical protein
MLLQLDDLRGARDRSRLVGTEADHSTCTAGRWRDRRRCMPLLSASCRAFASIRDYPTSCEAGRNSADLVSLICAAVSRVATGKLRIHIDLAEQPRQGNDTSLRAETLRARDLTIPSTERSTPDGVGALGLAVAERLATMMGGRLTGETCRRMARCAVLNCRSPSMPPIRSRSICAAPGADCCQRHRFCWRPVRDATASR